MLRVFVSVLFLGAVYVSGQTTSVTCDDNSECQSQTLNKDYVYCTGNYGCQRGHITSTERTYCFGNYGCYASVNEPAKYMYCDGNYACSLAEVVEAQYLYVRGCYGLLNGKATGLADPTSQSSVYCEGSFGCYGAQLSGYDRYYGYGNYGMRQATIDTTDVATVSIYLQGRYSGSDLAIWCRSGSTCNIQCDGTGCYNTRVLCFGGATCTITCDDSADSCPTKIDVSPAPAPPSPSTSVQAMLDERVQKHEQAREDSRQKLQQMGPEKFQEYLDAQSAREVERDERAHEEYMLAQASALAPAKSLLHGTSLYYVFAACVVSLMAIVALKCYSTRKFSDMEYQPLSSVGF